VKISASRLSTWTTCARQAHLKYDVGLPRRQSGKATFGSVMHLSVKEYFDFRGDYDRALALFLDLWAHPDKVGLRPDYWPRMTSYASLKAKGQEILERLHAQEMFRTIDVLATELPFLVAFGNHELNGVIDMIAVETSGTGKKLVKIIDWKTAASDPTRAELALNQQLTIYSFAAAQRATWEGIDGNPNYPGVPNGSWIFDTLVDMLPRRCIWFSLWNGKELDAGPRDTKDFERLNRAITEIERSQEAGIWIPNIGDACTFCDFTEDCGLEIPVAIAQVSNPDDPNRWI
jgi:RecB family exonuclease